MEDVPGRTAGERSNWTYPDSHVRSPRRLAMATLPVRRSGRRNLTVVNPSHEFEDAAKPHRIEISG